MILAFQNYFGVNLKGRYLGFNEILASPVGGFYFTHQYNEGKFRPEENSPEDILGMVTEMLDRLDGKFISHDEDEILHSRYMSLFKPGHYSYGAVSRVSIAFLRRHKLLFAEC